VIRILIADDHAVVRQGLRYVIEHETDIRVMREAGDGLEALEAARAGTYDALVLDVSMPGMCGIEVVSTLRAEGNGTPALLLSMYPENAYAVRAIKSGASGYLTKESAAEELVKAIRAIASGGTYISASLAARLAANAPRSPASSPAT
jgi:two-component system invasion response regulator UvrY